MPRRVSNVVSGPVNFGKISDDHWHQPIWINETRAEEGRHKMEKDEVIYGGSVPSVSPPRSIPSAGLTCTCLDIVICAVSTLGYLLSSRVVPPLYPLLMHVPA